jgi:hypothetical protein
MDRLATVSDQIGDPCHSNGINTEVTLGGRPDSPSGP